MDAPNICNIYNFFHICCIFATVGTASWCIYRYTLNEDLTINSFHRFNENEESIYPSISLCFPQPCLKEKLQRMKINATCKEYLDLDEDFNENFITIDNDLFTIDLKEYLLKTILELKNKTNLSYDPMKVDQTSNRLRPPYRAVVSHPFKCYTFDIPYIPQTLFNSFQILLKRSFPYLNSTQIAIHYPNQINQGDISMIYLQKDLNLDGKTTTKDIEIDIASTTTLSRRQKSGLNCNIEWKKDDICIVEAMANYLNCRHPNIDLSPHLPPCPTKKLREFSWNNMRKYPPPCISIIDSATTAHWSDEQSLNNKIITFNVRFFSNGKFMKISQVI